MLIERAVRAAPEGLSAFLPVQAHRRKWRTKMVDGKIGTRLIVRSQNRVK